MITAGLTGGLGCGKSFVGRELARLGCQVIQADELGHEVLRQGGEAYGPVVERFGSGILRKDGQIDRALLAGIVFGDANHLADLNAIVHPAVQRREDELIAAAGQTSESVVVVEAAILVETGLYRRFDKLVVVACTPAQQMERALARDTGGTREQILARIGRQMPIEEKRMFADIVIDTSGTKEETIRQTRELYVELRRMAGRGGSAAGNAARIEEA